MELTHSFTVPTGMDAAWAAFQDVASVAECFPGAVVTSVDGDSFQGTCKVKLGPIALQYSGSGTFVQRDESTHRLVMEAKGRDKRGNGTAGATVSATFAAAGGSETRVEVSTDLQITGKPAQFGRGVIQDVSDKLLQQFVTCLQSRISASPGEPAPAESPGTPVSHRMPENGNSPEDAPSGEFQEADIRWETGDEAGGGGSAASGSEALDLGATVLPVLVRSYGRQVAAVLGVLLLFRWVTRRRG